MLSNHDLLFYVVNSSSPSSGRTLHPSRRSRSHAHGHLSLTLLLHNPLPTNFLCTNSRRTLVPIINHLSGQNRIENEPGHEAIQDQLIIHLLQRREDTRQRSSKVIKHLLTTQLHQPKTRIFPFLFSHKTNPPPLFPTRPRNEPTVKALNWPVPP